MEIDGTRNGEQKMRKQVTDFAVMLSSLAYALALARLDNVTAVQKQKTKMQMENVEEAVVEGGWWENNARRKGMVKKGGWLVLHSVVSNNVSFFENVMSVLSIAFAFNIWFVYKHSAFF